MLLDDARGSVDVEECYCMEEGQMTILVLVGADRRKLYELGHQQVSLKVWAYVGFGSCC